MPKNQFQRPLPVNHTHKVPRHGKTQPPLPKSGAKTLVKEHSASLPPLSELLGPKGKH
jgi:hypothetical protein